LAIGFVVLLIACINFINLSTARASRRAREVMVRKVAGASRATLVVHFLGESFIYVALAACMALAFTELLLPHVNAFVSGAATLDYTADPALIGWIALGTLLLTLIAGLYPAFVLSSFRPASVVKGLIAHSHGANLTRQILVTLQFAALIALMVSAIVVYQQRSFATRDALRVATDQHLVIRGACRGALKTELRALPGVRGVACATSSLLDGSAFSNIRLKDGTQTAVGEAGVETGALELFGLRPLAGRFFAAADAGSRAHVVINETAVRRFGFASPAAAIGRTIPEEGKEKQPSEIVGVVRDFALFSVEREIGPIVYVAYAANPRFPGIVDVKLTGRQIPETLAALDRLWKMTGATEPPDSFFLDDYIQGLYLSVLRFAQAFAVMSGVAVLLACLGLIGLCASATDRRKKEIGVRKAMGAGVAAILRLFVWQFTKPVLWAALIAWPASAFLMNRWLEGFAYHIDLTPWPFVASAAVALVVALLTVSVHSYTVARSKPVEALRYE
jgi:putative ABC transport system permease protein